MPENIKRRKPCLICGTENPGVHLRKGNYDILRCTSCSCTYLNQEVNYNWISKFYSSEYFETGSDNRGYESYSDCKDFLYLNFKRRFRYLDRLVKGGNVLDIGCGYGYFLNCLSTSYTGFGIDVSKYAIQVARDKYRLNVRSGTLMKDTYPQNFFSLITMWDVIEHIPDPKSTLEIVRGILEESGFFALTTGNVDSLIARMSGKRWHLYTLPEHLWFFSPKTLTTLLEQCGFRILEISNDWNYYSVDYLIERLFKSSFSKKPSLKRTQFGNFFKKIMFPLSLGDIMYVVCRKIL